MLIVLLFPGAIVLTLQQIDLSQNSIDLIFYKIDTYVTFLL